MRRAHFPRWFRAVRASAVVLGIVVGCSVADKGEYTFTDEPDGSGGNRGGRGGSAPGSGGSSSGTAGSGATSGDGGSPDQGGTSMGGSAGNAGTTGGGGTSAGDGGEGGMATGGSAGQSGTCGDGNLDVGEDCDDNNLVNEPCAYFATACDGCSDRCRRIRPPSCGDAVMNGVAPQSFGIEYLATSCSTGVPSEVPLFLNGVRIPGLSYGAPCSCQPGVRNVTVSSPEILAALRQQGNVLSLLGTSSTEYLAWAIITVGFGDGTRTTRTAYDFGANGDAETRAPGPASCTFPPSATENFFGWGISDGLPFGGFPIEQCDGGAGCSNCSLPQCITLTSGDPVLLPDFDVAGMGGTAQSTIWVPQLGTIRDVDVSLKADHSMVSDLSITLRSPTLEVTLVNQRGGMGQNFVDTMFDSACTTPISQGTAPFTGCFAPETSLDGFNNHPSSIGPWFLTFKDHVAGNTGRLNGWLLKVCGVP